MKIHLSSLLEGSAKVALLLVLLGSCTTIPRSERKKMPDLALQGQEYSMPDLLPIDGTIPPGTLAEEGLPFGVRMCDTVITSGGTVAHFLFIDLPAASYGFLAARAADYEPLAIPYLQEWARHTQQKGILISLRSSEEDPQRASFVLEGLQERFSIPVILLWDKPSADRAVALTAVLRRLPAVQCLSGRKL